MSNPFDQMAASLTADRSPERVDLHEHIEALIAQHGGLNNAAHACGLAPAYLCRIRTGKAPASDDAVLRMGLRRVTYYERA